MARSHPWSILILAPALFMSGCTSTAPAGHEPRNLSELKAEIYAYVDSGRYDADLAAVAGPARAWIEERAGRKQPGEKLAVVFDIDETALSNLPEMRRFDFGYEFETWEAWIKEAKGLPIQPVREVHRAALSHGVAVFFITARLESDRTATERNLRAAGFDGYAMVYCVPDGSKIASAEAYKTAQRKQLAAQGYTIIANIGDQVSDLNGGYAERMFKLPDPFYLIK